MKKQTSKEQKIKPGTSAKWQPGTVSNMADERRYEEVLDKRRETILAQAQKDYDDFLKNRTFRFPIWQYGQPKGKLFRVECEDNPNFGETSFLEFDSGRTAFVLIDFQIDFCGEKGYVDVMKYPLENTAVPLLATRKVLDAVRNTDITVIHTREGHLPDLSDCPYNKLLRSKIIGKGVGIGEKPKGGIGRLLVRGSKSWGIVKEVEPVEGEILVDKAGKGAGGLSTLYPTLRNLGITHLVIVGITTDVCVNSIMTEANDLGFWCLLLKDCTGATDKGNYAAAIKSTKMQGGVFGWVSDSEKFISALNDV
ncbi:MAG: cysteine hydrolase family protein [Daejeonella sp.]|uniref:cysteine hydrolase family protein n=1 Tax=Daejeonella sp. JGW-45 TaxID=3034148 RepID=UPI0023EB2566|nr:cysteine hydrolase [Daejeonella sp. JGW-45]